MAGLVVQRQHVDSIPLAVIRGQASLSELTRVVPELCGRVWNVLRAQHLRGGRNIAVYWDEAIRLEVGVEMPGAFAEQDYVVRSATPAGAVATVTYFGPYAGLAAAHETVRAWARANNHRLAGPNWEIYGHWKTEWETNPSQIRTDVFYLLATSDEG